MSASATVELFKDEKSSFYNTHLVTKNLDETYIQMMPQSPLAFQETEVGGRSGNLHNEAEAASL